MAYSGNPTVKRFRTDMLNVSEFLKGSLEEAYSRQADELMGNMRANVPEDTGALKRSIRKKVIRGRNRVTVLVAAGGPLTTKRTAGGESYDYALSVEFGDTEHEAEPFFYSAARRYKTASHEIARETVAKAIEENNRVRALRSENLTIGDFTNTRGGRGGAVVYKGKI